VTQALGLILIIQMVLRCPDLLPLHDDQPTKETPVITILLMAVCATVFVSQLTLQDSEERDLLFGLGVIPAVLLGPLQLPPKNDIVHPMITLFHPYFYTAVSSRLYYSHGGSEWGRGRHSWGVLTSPS
jgi:hypothetical protein